MSHSVALRVSVLVLYGASFVTSLVGNIMALYIIRRRHRGSHGAHSDAGRRRVALLFVNMIVADLAVTLIAMPEGTAFYFRENQWPAGPGADMLCRLIQFSFPVSIAASILTLSAMTLDRFVRIVCWASRGRVDVQFRTYAVAIWLSSALLMSHRLLVYKTASGNCAVDWSLFGISDGTGNRISNVIYIILLFAAPLVLIAVLSFIMCFKLSHPATGHMDIRSAAEARQDHRNTIKLLIAIVVLFIICWLPVQFMHLLRALGTGKVAPPLMFLCFWCGHSYSAVNPWIYIFLQPAFRGEFCKCFFRKKPSKSPPEIVVPRHDGASQSVSAL